MCSLASRRDIVRLFSGSLVGWTIMPSASRLAAAQPAGGVRLGDSRDAFDAALGPGTDVEGGLVRYGSGAAGTVTYHVRFSNGIGEHVDVDLSQLAGGGVPVEGADIGNSRFLPDDVAPTPFAFSAGTMQMTFDAFDVTSWHSPSLASATGRSGHMLVLDQHAVWGDGMSGPPPYHRATVSMETFDVREVVPHGETTVIGAPFDAWRSAYGQAPASQRGAHVASPPVERLFIGVDYSTYAVNELDVLAEAPLDPKVAIDLIGSFVPADAALEQTFYAGPSPVSEYGVRTRIWAIPSMSTYAMAMVTSSGDEATGSVVRILMATSKSS